MRDEIHPYDDGIEDQDNVMTPHFNRNSTHDDYVLFGVRLRIILSAEQTNNQFCVVEGVMPAGGDSGLHVHHREDESMLIAEGTLEVTIGTVTTVLGAGDSYFAPRGIPHRIRNVGTTPMRSTMIATPGGFDSFVMKAGIPVPVTADTPAMPAPTAEQMGHVVAMLHAWGMEMLIPPDAP